MRRFTLLGFLFFILLACSNDKVDDIGIFAEDLAPICIGGKYGYIDTNGVIKIPCQYSYAGEFSYGYGRVESKGKFGFIDATGKYLIKPVYDNVTWFVDGFSVLDSAGLHGVINTKGEFVLEFQANECSSVHNDMIEIETSTGVTFYNIKTKTEIGKKYDKVHHFNDGLAPVCINEKWGLINKVGELKVDFEYDKMGEYSEGVVKVSKENKIGFIDSVGKIIIPFSFPLIDLTDFSFGFNSFSENLSIFSDNSNGFIQKGYINKQGVKIIPATFDRCNQFLNGYALIEKFRLWGLINSQGEMVVKPEFNYVWQGDDNIFMVSKNKKYGFIDDKGKVIFDLEFDDATPFYKGRAIGIKDGIVKVLRLDK